MPPRLALITLGAANRASISSALERAGGKPYFVEEPEQLRDADAIVFPGVANFGYLADVVDRRNLREALVGAIRDGMPFLGICAGYQLLFERSEEQPEARGLGIFNGQVKLLAGPRSPQIGWNTVEFTDGTMREGRAYFANAYAVPVVQETIAVTTYGTAFTSIVARDAVLGAQFHPERSGAFGAQFLADFVKTVRVRSAC